VTFRRNPSLCTGKKTAREYQARQLAAEIVEFSEAHPFLKESGWQFFQRADFAAAGFMRTSLQSLRLVRVTDDAMAVSVCSWNCSNITTAHIGISMDYIKSAIAQKNRKAANYNWRNAEEKSLLIVAGGGDVNTSAPRSDEGVEWREPALVNLCATSPFDRIVFWNRVHQWHRWLK
jgi:hypothetical protein